MKRESELIATIDALPTDEKISLASHIWDSLHVVDTKIQDAWLKEADKRWKDFKSGKTKAITHDEFKRRHLK